MMKFLPPIFLTCISFVLSQVITGAWPPTSTFQNPVFWEDLADLDVFRVNDTFYYSSSTMHYSPGAPVLRSYDLINWEYIGHSVPVLDFGDDYYLIGGEAYVRGVWASFLRFRKSNGIWYWGGCVDFSETHIFTSSSPEGPWTENPALDTCFYDAGLLIDDTDTMYVAHESTNIAVSQMSNDGLSIVRTEIVYNSTIGYIEGSRFYQVNGNYYIFVTQPASSEYVLMSTDGPWGPYEIRPVVVAITSPVHGSGNPHQGGIVDTPDGDWYYMAFVDSYPGGRAPVLAPITWGDDGWPTLDSVDGVWNSSYPYPNVALPSQSVASPTGIDNFEGTSLNANWEWNHNPNTSQFSVNNGLTLRTATVTDDLYLAQNTLTHRILGPSSSATILLDYTHMINGDRAGLALFRDQSAWVGVQMDDGVTKLSYVDNIMMNSTWNTISTGTVQASVSIPLASSIYLSLSADIRPGGTGTTSGVFSYSLDGVAFEALGTFAMDTTWEFFMGYRFAIFNYATIAIGGSVNIDSFELALITV